MSLRGRGVFVTGTDTGVGKTQVTLGMMFCLQRYALKVAGMKPVASGCHWTDGGLRNCDALAIQQQSTVSLPYGDINPYAFERPIAPHLAAEDAGGAIAMVSIADAYQRIRRQVDWCIVEGVGGWLVPLSARQTTADLVRYLDLTVILVVGLRLGCLNHTLLSVESIQHRGVQLVGWIANHIDRDMVSPERNIDTLRGWIPAPLIGTVPFKGEPCAESFAPHLCSGLTGLIDS